MVKRSDKSKFRKSKIEDVEDALEDERRIHKMKNKLTEDGDDELFTVDTKGSCEGLSRSSRREIARAKIFPKKGPNIGLNASEEGKIARAERQVEAGRKPKAAAAPDVFDLWGTPAPSALVNTHSGFNRVRSVQKSRAPIRAPGTANQKVGLAPAVLPAHEGQSINPQREAYEDLACMAAAAELEKEREHDETNRKLRPMTHELIEAVGIERFREMSEEEKFSLYKSLHSRKSAGDEADEEVKLSEKARAKKWNAKSQAYRNKKKKKRGADSQAEQAKAQQRLDRSVGELGNMLKGMKEHDEWRTDRKKYRESLRAKRRELEATTGIVPKKRKIGGGQYVEEAAIVPDAESGAKGLRSMPLRASAIRERLSSVVRRGLLPPPSEATREKQNWYKRKNNKLRRGKKFVSPLLKDNLLLR